MQLSKAACDLSLNLSSRLRDMGHVQSRGARRLPKASEVTEHCLCFYLVRFRAGTPSRRRPGSPRDRFLEGSRLREGCEPSASGLGTLHHAGAQRIVFEWFEAHGRRGQGAVGFSAARKVRGWTVARLPPGPGRALQRPRCAGRASAQEKPDRGCRGPGAGLRMAGSHTLAQTASLQALAEAVPTMTALRILYLESNKIQANGQEAFGCQPNCFAKRLSTQCSYCAAARRCWRRSEHIEAGGCDDRSWICKCAGPRRPEARKATPRGRRSTLEVSSLPGSSP